MASMFTDETRLLASYSTYKALYDDHKNVYQIVAAFINDAVVHDTYTSIYTQSDISKLLNKRFGFNVPNVVIGTAVKKHVECLKSIGNLEYKFIRSKAKDDALFSLKIDESISRANDVYKGFRDYLESINSDYDINTVNDAFVNCLLDKGGVEDDLKAHISRYVLVNSNSNPLFKETLNNIRRGQCLLTGLTNNDAIGSTNNWNTSLVIYLDTEILFHIAGYNGALYQKIAQDFLDVVNEANKKQTFVKLRFFPDTKNEVTDYFSYVRWNMNQGDVIRPHRSAMKCLLKKCRTDSDLVEEEAQLFALLSRIGIHEDSKTDYNFSGSEKYNFEDLNLEEKYAEDIEKRDELDRDRDEDRRREKAGRRLRAVSNINKLRKGEFHKDYRDCQYIFVTCTGQTISISKEMMRGWINDSQDKITYSPVEYAVSLSDITNALWYRLNNTLLIGKDANFPLETDATIRAQIILASLVQRKVEDIFDKVKEELDDGSRTKDDVIARFGALFDRICNPEDITAETVDQDVTIITSNDLEAYENEHDYLMAENRENKERIAELEKEGNLKDKELDELRREKEIHDLEEIIRKCEESIRQHTKAARHVKRRHRIVDGLVVTMIVIVIIGVWIWVSKVGWDIAEKYTFLILFAIDGLLLIVGILGWRIGLKSLSTKLGDYWSKKYEEDISVDIEDIQRQRTSAIERLDQLNQQNRCGYTDTVFRNGS